jgi:hypothetical protein
MPELALTPSQMDLIRGLATRFPPQRIDRFWLFPPHHGDARESGFVVLSLLPEAEADDQRTLVTVRYDSTAVKGRWQRQERTTEEGSAPPDSVERVMAGVLLRAGEGTDPFVERIEGDPERWGRLLERLGIAA